MKQLFFCLTILFFTPKLSHGRILSNFPDTITIDSTKIKSNHFYDSLKVRAHRHRFYGLLYDVIISSPQKHKDKKTSLYEYYKLFDGKTIASIRIQPLNVFGSTFEDTTKVPNSKLERFANSIHTKSNLKVLRRNLWIKEGQTFNANILMDNERFLRELSYIKDVRIIINERPANNQLVDLLILTKDVFAFGVTGDIDDIDAGELGIYNQNVLGIGHEMTAIFVGNTDEKPYTGIDASYSINNLAGNFINTELRYIDTYKKRGYLINLEKEFQRIETKWGGGFNYSRYFRNNQVNANDPVTTDYELDYYWLDSWYGRNLQVNKTKYKHPQLTFSGRIRFLHFNDRPIPDESNNQYFANSTFFMGNINLSQRWYIQDQLIYSYGITEDIPKGYLHEFTFGFDNNEYSKRWYSHLFLSTGNIFKYKPYYLYTSAAIGGFFNKSRFEQGMLETNINYISNLCKIGNINWRRFIKMNYILGIRRYDIEELYLRNKDGIRGFSGTIASGTQRLCLNLESVFFQKKEILSFNSAFFSFFDLGIIGSNQKIIFTQDYYAGLGCGFRLRNENLVFKTIQIRLAYYPWCPSNMHSIGFILEEQSKTRFYNFQPQKPDLLEFR